jgi:hypothetical protein
VAVPVDRNVTQNEAEKKLNTRVFYSDATNVEHKMYDYAGNNWSHRKSKKKSLKKNLEAIPGKHSID